MEDVKAIMVEGPVRFVLRPELVSEGVQVERKTPNDQSEVESNSEGTRLAFDLKSQRVE